MKKFIPFILTLIVLSYPTYSQSVFWKNIKIRKAFETKTEDDDKAANLSFTFPKDKPNSFLINAGIGYEFANTSKVSEDNKIFRNSFTGFFVYNTNNQLDKEQKNYKLGVTSNQIFLTDVNTSTGIFGSNTIQYLRNYRDSTHSILLTSYWHPFSKKLNHIKIGGYAQADNLFAYYLLPLIGLEYQDNIEAKKSAMKGYDFRGCFSIGGSLLLKKKTYDDSAKILPKNRWTKGIELKVTYDGRISLFRSLHNQDSYVPMFKSELIFYPTQDNKLSIGLSYNNGANPVDGLVKQTFWLLAFKFKK